MKNKLLWTVTLLPSVITLLALPFLPDQMPMHYDLSGTVDRYGSKYEQFTFPMMIIGFTVFFLFIIHHYVKKAQNSTEDKQKQEALSNIKVLRITATAMALMFTAMHLFILITSTLGAQEGLTHMPFDISSFTGICLGIFMIVIGNIVPKAKRNSTVGIRTPWSFYNEQTWAKSNRIGGRILMIGGILIIIGSFFTTGLWATFWLLYVTIVSGILMTVYSYKVYKEEVNKNTPK